MAKRLRTNCLGALAVALMSLATVSCDGHHDVIDTSMQIGHVVCTDGKVMTYDDATANGKQPIAVVFHINHDEDIEGRGYAVYLDDLSENGYAIADSLGVKQGTSSNLAALDGNTNTFALYTSPKMGSPAATAVFDMWTYGQSAYIPSVAQLRLLYGNITAVDAMIAKCGGSPITQDNGNGWLWSSTEVAGAETHQAWLYSVSSGAIQETPKDQVHRVRPIITIND